MDLFFSFFLLVVLVLVLITLYSYQTINQFRYETIPKIIFSYWHDEHHIPKIVKICWEKLRFYHPDYKIVILHQTNYQKWCDPQIFPLFHDSHARFSDLLRLCLHSKHGGIWCDASLLCFQSLSTVFSFSKRAEFYGFSVTYSYPRPFPIIESWLLVATQKSIFLQQWFDEFKSIVTFRSIEKYVQSRKKMRVDLNDWSCSPEYLAIHVACQKVLQINHYSLDSLVLYEAEKGPFRYLVEHNWDAKMALSKMFHKKKSHPLIKLRSVERKILENHPELYDQLLKKLILLKRIP